MTNRTPNLRRCTREGCHNLAPTRSSKVLCGPECRKWSHARSKGEYRERNRAALREAGRAYAAAKYVPRQTLVRCLLEGCHNLYLFTSGKKGFCSQRCRTERSNAASKAYASRNPEKRRAYQIKKHGITVEQFDALLSGQGGRCAVCRTSEPNGPHNQWGIDHDHECCPGALSCGACVRGVVCDRCNKGMGVMADDPVVLRRAAEYIEAHRARRLRIAS